MRIIGEINDLPFKVTVLEMNNRVAIKLEDGQNEITYKFREGSAISNFEDVKTFLSSQEALEKLQEAFINIQTTRSDIIQNMMDRRGIDLPVII